MKQFYKPLHFFIFFLVVTFQSLAQAPVISSFSPASGPVGSLVTINGSNLSGLTAFSIGNKQAITISNTSTKVVGFVMPDAVTGNISVTSAKGTASSATDFTVDVKLAPSVQESDKLASDKVASTTSALEGYSVALSADGNTAVVGGPNDFNGYGAIYIYTRTSGIWEQEYTLTGSGKSGSGRFGYSVAISANGNTAIAGGYTDNNLNGGVWVFTRSNGTWLQQGGKLKGLGNEGPAQFGYSVAVSADGNTFVAGGPADGNSTTGAAWVFKRTGSQWTQQGDKLVGTKTTATKQGTAVAISADGNTILSGSTEDGAKGSVWVFVKSDGGWVQQTRLTNSISANRLGHTVALSADGNSAFVGESNGNANARAWMFTRTGTSWSTAAGIGSSLTSATSKVGLSGDGKTALIGGPDFNTAVIYSKKDGIWNSSQATTLSASGVLAGQNFGAAVALSADGGTAIVGGPTTESQIKNDGSWAFVGDDAADLASITLSSGTIPAFAPAVNNYTVQVANTVKALSLTAVSKYPGSVIELNGQTIASGQASIFLPVSGGNTIFTLTVTSASNRKKVYKLTVFKQSSASKLSKLSLFVVKNNDYSPWNLSPAFVADTTNYSTFVSSDVSAVRVSPTINNQPFATIKVNNVLVNSGNISENIPIVSGHNPVSVLVTAQDGSTTTYSISIRRSDNPFLNLSFFPASGKPGSLVTITGSGFDPDITENYVFFGTVKAEVVTATETSLTVKVPVSTEFLLDASTVITVTNRYTAETGISNTEFTVVAPPSTDAISFSPKVDFGTGIGPVWVMAAKDQITYKDIVTVNLQGSVSAYRAGRSGYFLEGSTAAKVDFAIGATPLGGALGDLDGDNNPDIITANSADNTISVLIHYAFTSTPPNDPLSYRSRTDFTSGGSPNSIALGDLDGDGKSDVVATNSNNTFSVFRNMIMVKSGFSFPATPAFAPRMDISTSSQASFAAISDMNGDGKPDVLISSADDNSVSIYINTSQTGSISFAAPVNFATGTSPKHFVVGDIDGDGKTDVISANYGGSSFSVLRNTSSGGAINFAGKVDISTSIPVNALAIGDLNNDGKPELVSANTQATVSVFPNSSTPGSISFGDKLDYATASVPGSVVIFDTDGDGKADIISANRSTNNISVIRNTLCYCAPTITSFSPTKAPSGATVNITGTNFLGTQGIVINNVPVSSFTVNSSTSVSAVLGMSSSGNGNIVLTNFSGTATKGTFNTLSSDVRLSGLKPSVGVLFPDFWTYITEYKIEVPSSTSSIALTPEAPVNSTVYINGAYVENFNPSPGIPLNNDSNIIEVSVTAEDGVLTEKYIVNVVKVFPPAITSFTPAVAGTGGAVSITGSKFINVTAISFGGTPATSFTVNSPTSITAVVGQGASGDIAVTTKGGTGSKAGFTYGSSTLALISTPQGALSPVFASDKFGYSLTVLPITENVLALAIVPTSTSSVVTITRGTVVSKSGNVYYIGLNTGLNTINVKVTAANGTTSSLYTLVVTRSSAEITSFAPNVGYQGAVITLKGSGLTGATGVTFGGTPARSFTVSDDGTSVTAVVDSGSTGEIYVTSPISVARVKGFVYDKSPKITSFTPTRIIAPGGSVTLTGINFTGITSVTIGDEPVAFVINSSTSITATPDKERGGVIKVSGPSGTNSTFAQLFVIYVPVITSFSPTSGPPGTAITIVGTRLEGPRVTFGGAAARSVEVVSPDTVIAVVGYGATGDIKLDTPVGSSSMSGFVFIPGPPTVYGLSKNVGSLGTSIELYGTNFIDVHSVTIGGTVVLNYTVTSAESITVTVGYGSSGLVSVTTAYGGGALSTPFIFVNANQIVADESGLVTLAPITPELLVISPTQALTLTIPVSVTNPTINYDLLITNGTGTLPQTTVASAIASMTIATATTVTGSSTWNGVIAAPTISSYNIPATPGQLTTTGLVIEVGDPNGSLSFNKGVRLVLPGQAGMRVGFVHSGIFTEITAVGSADNQAAGDALAPNSAFKMNVGGDLVVWTKGFSQFITFNISVDPDVALVAADKAALTNALPLPATGSVGGSSITWSTNSPGLVSPDGRIIARPAAGMPDATVTLTATIKKGLIIDTKQFAIVVPALPFTLPATNFKLAVTGESCNTSNNGSVLITATTVLPYIAVITGNGISKSFAFTGFVNIPSLSAGNYSIAITVDGRTGYKQSFDVVITEPKDLSLYVAVNPNANTISLDLAGGSMYHIDLNGTRYSTTNDKITLALSKGANSLTVSTDKECQGIINKEINLNTEAKLFPNPFIGVLNVDLGSASSSRATVDIRDLAGKSVFAKTFTNPEGSLDLDLAGVNPGVYLLKLSLDHSESVYKIIKQ